MSQPSDVRFVLVRPRNSGNVGSVVRVLSNFGFPPPRIVRMFRFAEAEARQMAAGCEEAVARIEFYDSLTNALSDRSFVVGTTALKRSRWRLEPVDQAAVNFTAEKWRHAAILFGNEKSGLSEDELAHCERIVTIPTAGYRSLNLSHAVAIMAWEFRKAIEHRPIERGPQLAPRALTEPMFEQMFQALEAISFLHPGQNERVRIMLRQMFSRNGLTQREVQILRGIFHQVLWLAGRSQSSSPSSDDASDSSS